MNSADADAENTKEAPPATCVKDGTGQIQAGARFPQAIWTWTTGSDRFRCHRARQLVAYLMAVDRCSRI